MPSEMESRFMALACALGAVVGLLQLKQVTVPAEIDQLFGEIGVLLQPEGGAAAISTLRIVRAAAKRVVDGASPV